MKNVLWSRASVSVCVSVCLSVRDRMLTLLHEPDVTWGSGRGCPLVVHCWADLQSVHGLRCYGNITRTRNISECMLVFALCLVYDSGFEQSPSVIVQQATAFSVTAV